VEQANKEGSDRDVSLGRLDAFCQRAIFGTILFILVWAPLALGSTGPVAFLVIQGATAVALALWAVRWWVQRPFRLCWSPVCWAVLVFLLYALPRCQLVDVQYVGRQQLTRIIVYAALFFLVLHNLNRKESATIVAMTLIAVGFVLAFWGMMQFVKHYPTLLGVIRPTQYLARASGTFVNPNNFAAYLEMIVPIALAYVVMGRLSPTVKVVLAYCVLAMLVGIAMSVSRGGIIAMAVTLVLFCFVLLTQRDFRLPAVITLGILLMVGLVFATQFESMQRRFAAALHAERADFNGRVFYWQAAKDLYALHPVWGVGPGHYDVEFPSVRPFQVQQRPEYAHNDYLNTLCEWGTVGMGIIAVFCGLLAWQVVQAWKAFGSSSSESVLKKSDRRAFILGAAAGLFAVMIHCIIDFNMQIPGDAITAITLMALIAAHARFVSERYWKNPGVIGKICLTILALGAVVYLVGTGIHKGRETYWLRQAKNEKVSWSREKLCLKKAHEIAPDNAETDYLLGEGLRLISKDGGSGYVDSAKEAIRWFAAGMAINRFDPRFPLRIGMCLDWIDHVRDATHYFDLAEHLDPNNYYIALEDGRHCVALGDDEDAKRWISRSLQIAWSTEARMAQIYLMDHIADPTAKPPK
jgi:O-antigen ligase